MHDTCTLRGRSNRQPAACVGNDKARITHSVLSRFCLGSEANSVFIRVALSIANSLNAYSRRAPRLSSTVPTLNLGGKSMKKISMQLVSLLLLSGLTLFCANGASAHSALSSTQQVTSRSVAVLPVDTSHTESNFADGTDPVPPPMPLPGAPKPPPSRNVNSTSVFVADGTDPVPPPMPLPGAPKPARPITRTLTSTGGFVADGTDPVPPPMPLPGAPKPIKPPSHSA
jgi:hypothetical protein